MDSDPGKKVIPLIKEPSPLEIGIEAIPAILKTTGGREIQLTRAILVIRNTGPQPVSSLTPQATLAQESGLPHELSPDLKKDLPESLEPGALRQWDLYDLLAAGHPGVSSKVHLFGYKAVLNWWFTLTARVDYRPAASAPLRTSSFQARFRWNSQPPSLDKVDLAVEPL